MVSLLPLCLDKSDAATELKVNRMSMDEDQNCGNHPRGGGRSAWQPIRHLPFPQDIDLLGRSPSSYGGVGSVPVPVWKKTPARDEPGLGLVLHLYLPLAWLLSSGPGSR